MAGKYIDNDAYATSGYTLSGVFQSITLGPAGSIGGHGLLGGTIQAYAFVNDGSVTGTGVAVDLRDGGSVTNTAGALINGTAGISINSGSAAISTTLSNAGTVIGTVGYGVSLGAGLVSNNARSLIEGGTTGVSDNGGTISNAGTIFANGTYENCGIRLFRYSNDIVSNTGTGALIEGYRGIYSQSANLTLVNTGTIIGTGTSGQSGIELSVLVSGSGNAIITNGTNAVIEGGIYIAGKATITNSVGGLIEGGSGVKIGGGTIVNEAGALIEGSSGANIGGGSLSNAGTIIGTGGYGVAVGADGTVSNGAAMLIEGYTSGLRVDAGTVGNAGTIKATGGGGADGIQLVSDFSGHISNIGSASQIVGYGGIYGKAVSLALYNSGSVIATGSTGQRAINLRLGTSNAVITNYANALIQGGIYVGGGATVINGVGARIDGTQGINVLGIGEVTNSGTISAIGIGDDGILLQTGGIVANKSGGVIEGTVGVELHGDGTVDNFGTLASTAGAGGVALQFLSANEVLIDEAGSQFVGEVNGDGGSLLLAGATGTLTGLGSEFSDFDAVTLETGGKWSFTGTNILASGTTSSLVDNGVLTLSGTATASGTISGTGTLVLAGLESFTVGTALTVADLTQSAGTATLDASLTYAGKFAESGGTLSLGNKVLTLTGAAGFTGGTISGTGHLSTEAATTVSTLSFAGGAGWANYGTVTQSRSLTLGGTGTGGSRLSNESGAVFDVTGTGGIALATGGSGNIVNGGLIEKTGTGTSTIAAAIANNGGTIAVTAGTLDLAGAVTYTGKETIGKSGTLKFDGAVGTGQTISFAGPNGGELVLNDPSGSALSFTGTISGFGGSDKLDLSSFAYVTGSKPGWVQNGSSGTLTVTEGSKTAKITLFGQYVAAGFSATKDAAGDTLITYTTPAQVAALAPPHR